MSAQLERNLVREFELALDRGELHMAYQPKVLIDTGELTRLEALVRWDRPGSGPVEPSRFVPLAEKHGLIAPLTQAALSSLRALAEGTAASMPEEHRNRLRHLALIETTSEGDAITALGRERLVCDR